MLQLEEAQRRPSIAGDIDDVANLVSPSPRRKPGKLTQHKGQQQQQQSTVLKVESNDLGTSTLSDESGILGSGHKKRLSVDLYCDSTDNKKLNKSSTKNNVNEFNSHLVTPNLISADSNKAERGSLKQSS